MKQQTFGEEERTVYECEQCGFATMYSDGLERHVTRLHGDGEVKATVVCRNCGEEDEYYLSSYPDGKEFCSRKCKDSFDTADTVEGDCPWCGEHHERYVWELSDNQVHGNGYMFCDEECVRKYRTVHWTNEGSPAWKGGTTAAYGSFWEQRREEMLERYDYKCYDCGLGQEEHFDSYSRGLPVHHIVPYSNFLSDEHAHQPGNLVVLCCRCHAKWDSMTVEEQRARL